MKSTWHQNLSSAGLVFDLQKAVQKYVFRFESNFPFRADFGETKIARREAVQIVGDDVGALEFERATPSAIVKLRQETLVASA